MKLEFSVDVPISVWHECPSCKTTFPGMSDEDPYCCECGNERRIEELEGLLAKREAQIEDTKAIINKVLTPNRFTGKEYADILRAAIARLEEK